MTKLWTRVAGRTSRARSSAVAVRDEGRAARILACFSCGLGWVGGGWGGWTWSAWEEDVMEESVQPACNECHEPKDRLYTRW